MIRQPDTPSKAKECVYAYVINKLYYEQTKRMEEAGALKLFKEIEMPVLDVLADMQYQGIYVDKQELTEYGKELKERIEILTKEIYNLAGEEFNINSTKQLRRNFI